MPQSLKPIELIDHLLWPDGTVQVTPEKLIDFTFKLAAKGKTDCLSVTELTPEINQFNSFGEHQLTVKESVDPEIFPPEWILPEHYKYLDIDEYLLGLVDRIEKDDLYEKRVERLSSEIWLFKEQKLDDVLRVLIYVVDTMKEQNVIWGVGRGSSCSSYLLFLLGLHEVDAVRYSIEITDFLRHG
jgi:DNA polymerase III alpha subunit